MLLGRDAELATLDDAVDSLLAPGGDPLAHQVLALVGPPGIGKTSLLAHARARAQASNLFVLSASGVETEQRIAFAGLGDLLTPVADLFEALPKFQAEALAGSLALGPPVDGGQLTIAAATLGVLQRAAERRPVLIVVDDAQWLDPATELVLAYVARRLEGTQVMVFVGSRADGRPEWLDQHETLRIDPLDPLASAALLRRQAPDLSPVLRQSVLDASAGVPLALVEIPVDLAADVVTGAMPGSRLFRTSNRLGELFDRRVRQLSAESQLALLAAALTGAADLATLEVAWKRLGLSLSDIATAEKARLVRVADQRLHFVHPLVRNAAFHSASESDKRAAHGALADAVEQSTRGWHLAASTPGPSNEVADALLTSALDAFRKRAFLSSSAAYAESARRHTDPAERLRRWAAAADASQRGGDLRSAVAMSELGLAELPHVARTLTLPFLVERANLLMRVGSVKAAIPLLAEIADDPELDRNAAAFVDALGSYGHYMTGSVDEMVELAYRAESKLAPTSPAPTRAQTMTAVVRAAAVRGDQVRLDAALRELDALVPELTSDHSRLVPQVMFLLAQFGSAEAVVERAPALITKEREVGELNAIPALLMAQAVASQFTCRWDEAETLIEEAVVLAREVGLPAVTAQYLAFHVPALRGDYDRAKALIARAAANPGSTINDGAAVAMNEFNHGNFAVAAALFRVHWDRHRSKALTNWAPTRVTYASDAVEAMLIVGDHQGAQDVASQIWAWAEMNPHVLPEAWRVRGVLGGVDGYSPEECFAQALIHERLHPNTFVRARIHFGLGRSLRHSGRTGEARASLSSARDLFAELKAASWLERAETELRAAGGRRRRSGEKLKSLTSREMAIASGIARGRTNREIAVDLFVSPKTIEGHLSKMFVKLGVRNRTELGALIVSEPSILE